MIAVFIVVRSLPINLYRYKLNRILLCFDKREIMNLLGINILEFQIGILKKKSQIIPNFVNPIFSHSQIILLKKNPKFDEPILILQIYNPNIKLVLKIPILKIGLFAYGIILIPSAGFLFAQLCN